jgi:hypothetical protein
MVKKIIKFELALVGLIIFSSSFAQTMHFYNFSKNSCLQGGVVGGVGGDTGKLFPDTMNRTLEIPSGTYLMVLNQFDTASGCNTMIAQLNFNITISSNGYQIDVASKRCAQLVGHPSSCNQFTTQYFDSTFDPQFNLIDLP